jgi:glycosyltransferase involved in cell wall biosynthesis
LVTIQQYVRPDGAVAPTLQRTQTPLCNRVLVLITEDWFALSHFMPLLRELRELSRDVVLVAGSSGQLGAVERLGIRTIPFDMRRGSLNPLVQSGVARRLARIIDAERPDVVHAISLQPMLLASLAAKRAAHRPRALLLHVTGLGYAGVSRSPVAALARNTIFRLMRGASRRSQPWILAENPDDIAFVAARGVGREDRSALVPGAGVDPDAFPPLPPPRNEVPRVAYVGRLVRSKGVETLVAAFRRVNDRGVPLELVLYGKPDLRNPDAITPQTLARWCQIPGISWQGHTTDIPAVWREADIAVAPTLGGEGMPRAMLEAAACARPLIVSNVSGCKHFVRQGFEGQVVPPGDAEALADALISLACDPDMRRRQGALARSRLEAGYTTGAVAEALASTYRRMLAR